MSKLLELKELIKCGSVTGVKSFLKVNMDFDLNRIEHIPSPLVLMWHGNEEMLQVVRSLATQVDWDGDYSPLVLAIRQGSLTMVKTLVEHGADVNLRDGEIQRFSPLERAADCQELEITKWLLDNGADIYNFHPQRCALVQACFRGNVEMFCYLFEKLSHASDEHKNAKYQEEVLLFQAEEAESKLDINLFEYMYRYSLRTAIQAGDTEGHVQCAKILIQSGCIDLSLSVSPVLKMNTFDDPLLFAVNRLNVPVVKLLLIANCDVNTPREATLPLHMRYWSPCPAECPLDVALEPFEKECRFDNTDTNFQDTVSVTGLLMKVGCETKVDASRYENTEVYDAPPGLLNKISDVIASNHWSRLLLKGLCRLAIRKQMGCRQFQKNVEKLPLPKSLKDFVLMKDILGE